MLNHQLRMSREFFQKVYSLGVERHSEHLFVRTSGRFGKNKGSVVVSKRVLRGAVARHFLRRRVYSILKGVFPKLTHPTAVIVVAKKNIEKLSFEELKKEIETLLLQ